MLEEFRELLEDHDRETLPKALKPLGIEARVITPYHRVIKEKYAGRVEHLLHFFVDLGWRHEYVGLEKLLVNDTVVYLIDSEYYFGDRIYRGGDAEVEQYAYFQRAVLEAIPRLDFVPEIVHCNDWQTGMIPMLARTQYRGQMQEKMKYLLSIHNIAFQGWCSFERCSDFLGVDSAYYTPEFIELNGCANFLKAGCVFSDRINTVSPTYAEEIKTPYYGEYLQGILNARSAQLCGILNGIDTEAFNPATEKGLPANFTLDDLRGKAVCKEALQKKMDLDIRPDVPILSMVMRMTEQKGFELVMQQLDDMMRREKMQFILLGSGDARYENFMRGAEERYKGRLGIFLGYNEELAHLIYAGSDLFLMPSRFEPCGLSQMIAMRYGCLPIVRETGGLKDSVIPYNCFTGEGDGFSFRGFDSDEMRGVVRYAVETWYDPAARAALIRHAMEKDFSFERSAKTYTRLYIDMLDGFHETLPALVHDCRKGEYRSPFGAVTCGEKVTLSLKVISGKVNSASLVLLGTGIPNGRTEKKLKPEKNRWSVTVQTPETPCALRYFFRIGTRYGDRFLCADRTGLNAALCREEGEGFRLTVYRPDFETPEWFRRSVMYQIFPDRFGFYGAATAKRGIAYHKNLGRRVELHESLDEPVKYRPGKGEDKYLPNDFYGGTFKGIQKKLPYLRDLGVTCLYLNPIAEAASNHRYDTADYLKPDPILGTVADFENLCKAAKKQGIRIILDGVYSHTGDDSRYFDRYGRYAAVPDPAPAEPSAAASVKSSDADASAEVSGAVSAGAPEAAASMEAPAAASVPGACRSAQSPYFPWYTFNSYPEEYRCWWNFRELPEVDERNSSWQEFIITGENSVMKTWMRRGAAGWRLDVADEIPDDVLSLMRLQVKKENPDAPIIGEVWEDCVSKTGPEGPRNYALGCSLDSVMNYPLRFALIEFLTGRRNAWSMAEFLTCQQMNYPRPLYYALMNLVSSHDVDRIRTALAADCNLHELTREVLAEMKFTEEALDRALELEKLAAVAQFVLPGVPCIYYGDEQEMTGTCDPFNRAPFAEAESRELRDFYAGLAAKRKNEEALLSGEAAFYALSDDLLVILRYLPDGPAEYAILNRGDAEANYRADFSDRACGKVHGKIKGRSAKIVQIRQ